MLAGDRRHHRRGRRVVSILIRPEGRMLAHKVPYTTQRRERVSILIRPEGRMLALYDTTEREWQLAFQSSSGPRAGCWRSHSQPQTRDFPSFNPHPARGPDAGARAANAKVLIAYEFQSSSGPRAGCWAGEPQLVGSAPYSRSRVGEIASTLACASAGGVELWIDTRSSGGRGAPTMRFRMAAGGSHKVRIQKTNGPRWSNAGRVPNVSR